jgi:hypothetical protein
MLLSGPLLPTIHQAIQLPSGWLYQSLRTPSVRLTAFLDWPLREGDS